MNSWVTSFCAILLLVHTTVAIAETVHLRSGKQVEIIDGALTAKGAEEVLHEASDWLKKGRLDYAREYWSLLSEKGRSAPAERARALRERVKNIEYESFIVLGNGKRLKGKVAAYLRTDLLGLEGKDEIPIWQVEEIAAEYHPGLSQVSKTFYPLTVLEIKLRGLKLQTAKSSAEIEFVVEGADGSKEKALLGKFYQFLRQEDLAGQLEATTRDRIVKIVIYPGLAMIE